MKLLISQKDQIFDLIDENEYFSPNQFELIEGKLTDSTTKVKFKDSEYYFLFISNEGSLFSNYSPGYDSLLTSTTYLNWDLLIIEFEKWLFFLKRELNAKNKWERFFNVIETLHVSSITNTAKFSHKEFIELTVNINQIKSSLSNIGLLSEQHVAIVQRLDHLTELANDLNKFDWINLFIGTIVSIIIQLNVTKDNADAIWNLIRSTFHNLFLH